MLHIVSLDLLPHHVSDNTASHVQEERVLLLWVLIFHRIAFHDLIVFHKLSKDEMKQIVDIMLKQVTKRMEAQNIKLEIKDSVKDKIIEKGIDINYGARPLKRTIQNLIEDKIAEAILDGKVKQNKKAKIVVDEEGNIVIK